MKLIYDLLFFGPSPKMNKIWILANGAEGAPAKLLDGLFRGRPGGVVKALRSDHIDQWPISQNFQVGRVLEIVHEPVDRVIVEMFHNHAEADVLLVAAFEVKIQACRGRRESFGVHHKGPIVNASSMRVSDFLVHDGL